MGQNIPNSYKLFKMEENQVPLFSTRDCSNHFNKAPQARTIWYLLCFNTTWMAEKMTEYHLFYKCHLKPKWQKLNEVRISRKTFFLPKLHFFMKKSFSAAALKENWRKFFFSWILKFEFLQPSCFVTIRWLTSHDICPFNCSER